MPPKKPPLPAAINIRLKRDEGAAVVADVQALRESAGVPLTVSGYAKHALLSYGKLRRMEVKLRIMLEEYSKEGSALPNKDFVTRCLTLVKEAS